MSKFSALLGLVALAAAGHATTLDSTIAVDNDYSLYLSTNDATLGNLIGSGSDWMKADTYSGASLLAGQDYYIHVVGNNEGEFNSGNPAAFLGQFTLSGNDHKFANGGSTLLTGAAGWSVNNVGFGSAMVTPTEFGANGTGIWNSVHGGPIAGIGNAQWIWSADGGAKSTAYFSAKVQAVPEPASMAALAVGGLGLLRRRRK